MNTLQRVTLTAALGAFFMAGNIHAQTESSSTAAFEQSNAKMMQDMQNMQMSGMPDQDFAMMMMRHHQGAIDMAKIELQYGKDAELKKMAQKLVTEQQKEIGQLQDWMKRHPKK